MTMKKHKNFRALPDSVRGGDEYWVERAKIEFVEGLVREMENRSITRAQLAERIGASTAYITKVLRGDTNFTIESMVKLTRALGGNLSVQVTGKERRSRHPIAAA